MQHIHQETLIMFQDILERIAHGEQINEIHGIKQLYYHQAYSLPLAHAYELAVLLNTLAKCIPHLFGATELQRELTMKTYELMHDRFDEFLKEKENDR